MRAGSSLTVCCRCIHFSCRSAALPDMLTLVVVATGPVPKVALHVNLEPDRTLGVESTPSASNLSRVFRFSVLPHPLVMPEPALDSRANLKLGRTGLARQTSHGLIRQARPRVGRKASRPAPNMLIIPSGPLGGIRV